VSQSEADPTTLASLGLALARGVSWSCGGCRRVNPLLIDGDWFYGLVGIALVIVGVPIIVRARRTGETGRGS
jgi:hypothetical protein